MIGTIWAYRGFIHGSVAREFHARYRNSLLGALWAVLNPLAMVTIYTLIFSSVMQARLPGIEDPYAYSIYLCAGILTWNLFAEITGRGQNVFLENAALLKKLSFPRLCLPIIVILSALLNFAIVLGIFLAVLILIGRFPGLPLLGIIPVLAVQILFAVGLGILLGVLNVFFRDVGQFFAIALQFWFWLTPIVYPAAIIPERFRSLIELNPMVPVIGAYQRIFVQAAWPEWPTLLPITLLGGLVCILALHLFRKRSGEMVDEL